MSGRLLALVVLLAVASAAVGTGAAYLLRSSDDTLQPANEVTVVSTVPSAAQEAQPATVEQAEQADQAQEQSAQAGQPAQAGQSLQANQEDAQPAESTDMQAAQPEAEQQTQEEEPQQQAVDVEGAEEQPIIDDSEPLDQATLSPTVIAQGEAFTVTLESPDARAAAATVDGRSWDLSSPAEGTWWAIVAVPRDAEIGVTEVLIDLYGEGGVWLRTLTLSIVVLASTAPFEEIILGGAGAVLDPAEVQRDINVRFVEHTAVTGPPRWTGPWILPVEGEVSGVFGAKRSYDGVVGDEWHHGHDIAAQHGDPIVAPAHGTVVWTGELVLHGTGLIIDHGAGVYSGYWHMSLIAVREGFEVAPGDWLGNIGTTGLSTGPHLHWEVIIQGIDVDPIQWTGEAQPPIPSPSGRG